MWDVYGRTSEDDGLKLWNCGYAILLIMSYITLVLVISSAMSG